MFDLCRRAARVPVILFLLVALPAANTAAQSELFAYRERIREALSSPAAVAEFRIDFRVAALARSVSDPVRLVLPDGREYRLVPAVVQDRGDGGLLWRGELVGNDDAGEAVLTVHRGRVAGVLMLPGRAYELVPDAAGPGATRLLEIDERLFPQCGGGIPPPTEPRSTTEPVPSQRTHDPLVDLLVVYTPAARQAAGGTQQIQAQIQAAADLANAAYDFSQVHQNLALVGMQEIAYDESGVSAYEQLTWVRQNPGVASLRNAHLADVVALVSEYGGGVCGIAYAMGAGGVTPSFESHAFSMIYRPCMSSSMTLTHETGHNMGAHHDPANAPPPDQTPYPYSFGHNADGVFRTVMSYSNTCSEGCPMVARLSNPDVSYGGFPTGIANQRDNAQTLDNTGPVVEAFRNSVRIFADVPRHHWAWSWIEAVYNAGVAGGCGTDPLTYCPDATVSRAQITVFLLRAAEGAGYMPPPASGLFADVPLGSPFARWIEEVANRGIAAGCDGAPPRFCPADPVTREQMAVFLLKAIEGGGYTPPPATGYFADVPAGSPFAPWIEELVERGITSGCATAPPHYCPTAGVNRAAMAVFVGKAFGLPPP